VHVLILPGLVLDGAVEVKTDTSLDGHRYLEKW
jgi:hypothetical protein